MTSDSVFAFAPYRERPVRDTTNATDEIFATGGEAAMLRLQKDHDGYKAVVCLALCGRSKPSREEIVEVSND
jgi:hypothetical protein